MAMTMEELQQMLQRMTPAEQQALLQQTYGNIGTPTLNTDSRYGAEGQGTGTFTAGGLENLERTAEGFRGPIGAPFDQPGPGGVYGQYMGQFDPTGRLTGTEFTQQQRPSFLDQNGYLLPLLVAGGAGAFNALGGAGAAAGGGSAASFTPELMIGQGGQGAFAGAAPTVSAAGFTPEMMIGQGVTPISSNAPVLLADGAAAGFTPEMSIGQGAQGTFNPPAPNVPPVPNVPSVPPIPPGPGSSLPGPGSPPVDLTEASSFPNSPGSGTPNPLSNLINPTTGRLLTMGLGAALGGAGSGSTTATQNITVPEELRPFAQDLAERGRRFADEPFQPYTGQRFAGPNDAQRNAWEMVNQAVRNPTAQQTQAEDAYSRLLRAETPDFGRAERTNNQYIGATTPGANNAYIGQTTNSDTLQLARSLSNPYLGATTPGIGQQAQMSLPTSTTSVGTNALLGMNNPALQARIDQTANDITRNFNNVVNPQFDRMARASGSFGNTGVEQMRGEAQRNLAQEIGRAATDARMADYSLQAQLGESDIARRVGTSLADAQRNQNAMQAAQQFNIGTEFNRQGQNAQFAANDLARNLGAANQQAAMQLNAGQFDVSQRANDLNRNAQLAQNQGQFNASLAQSDLNRNAQLTQNEGQFNAQQGNFDITNRSNNYNAAQARAASTLPQWQGFAEQPFRNANALSTVGGQMNAYAQQPLDFDYEQYKAARDDRYNRLGLYGNLYGAARGGQSTTSSTSGGSPMAGLLGGAATGAGIYNLLTRY